jgi:hypothetical protein
VNINKHPILLQAYEVCLAIEKCVACVPVTEASIKASALGESIEKLIDAHAVENDRYRKALELVKHDIDADDHPRAWGAAFEALRASVL